MNISESVRAMTPPMYTTSQAAELVGRSRDTLKRWRDGGIYKPSDKRKFGKISVNLYSNEDIVAMRKIVRTIHPGPKAEVGSK